MTTRSVHQYVLGILRKLDIKEEDITKLQTGGPDGDLGSNEIKISNDKTIAVVDGSGVLFDPLGIDRTELTRLAMDRKMIIHFDANKLSKEGGKVLIEDKNVTLPDGTLIESGMQFRNSFHVNKLAAAEMFVPCGGRPESINVSNLDRLINEDGVPMFKYIVEGANLFITPNARIQLEKAGVILFRDASANKGGVTSSSLEVFSGLCMSDEIFDKNMRIKCGVIPEFYKRYVVDVQNIIERNARNEFECIWNEHQRTGRSRLDIADELSNVINTMSTELANEAKLWGNDTIKKKVISEYVPPSMLELVGIDDILKQTPESYLRAIFGAYLASNFVYQYGINATPFSFFDFIQKYT